jgi:hypothetical protein
MHTVLLVNGFKLLFREAAAAAATYTSTAAATMQYMCLPPGWGRVHTSLLAGTMRPSLVDTESLLSRTASALLHLRVCSPMHCCWQKPAGSAALLLYIRCCARQPLPLKLSVNACHMQVGRDICVLCAVVTPSPQTPVGHGTLPVQPKGPADLDTHDMQSSVISKTSSDFEAPVVHSNHRTWTSSCC